MIYLEVKMLKLIKKYTLIFLVTSAIATLCVIALPSTVVWFFILIALGIGLFISRKRI